MFFIHIIVAIIFSKILQGHGLLPIDIIIGSLIFSFLGIIYGNTILALQLWTLIIISSSTDV